MLAKALEPEKKRIATKIPKGIKEDIRRKKKQHSQKKAERNFNARNFM